MIQDVWSGRADAYRASPTHAAGDDLDLLVSWADPRPGLQALDVATGGGHVARRLRAAGAEVVSVDSAPGMEPDVVARAEALPFDDGSFDIVTVRIAPHHFDDVAAAVGEMARVARDRVVIEDTLYESEARERAYRLHDPTHVRCYTETEWTGFCEDAGLEVEEVVVLDKRRSFEDWLVRTNPAPADAAQVRELLADQIDGRGEIADRMILLRARKR
jgi:SAM-dependent methyltransferase